MVGLALEEAAGPEQDCGGDTEAGSMTVGGGVHGAGSPLPQLLEELGTESWGGDAGPPIDLWIGELVWTSVRAASLRGVSNVFICSGF